MVDLYGNLTSVPLRAVGRFAPRTSKRPQQASNEKQKRLSYAYDDPALSLSAFADDQAISKAGR